MDKKSDTFKVIKEDILRVLSERGGSSLDSLQEKIRASSSSISFGIQELEKQNLVRSQQLLFELTEKGKKAAQPILKRHRIVEEYFKKTRSEKEAHRAAHILEHYIFKEVSDNIKKLSTFRKESTSLVNIGLFQPRVIIDITVPNTSLFERLISTGIFPGEQIEIVDRIPKDFIVRVGSNKFAIDHSLAEDIKVADV